MWNYVLFSTIIIIVSLMCQYNLQKSLSIIDSPQDRYDYIVVGAGTAGCVIASRLSEDTNSTVLLIEAGGYFNWISTIPLVAPFMQGSSVDWSYKTESQFYSSAGLNDNQQSWPRGKGLGGSGQLNYLVHSFGRPEDFSEWPHEWSYANLQPYFKKVSSKMNIRFSAKENELTKAFFMSNKIINDENIAFWKPGITISDGARWSTYNAYLKEAWNRGNLHILIKTLLTKIVVDMYNKVEGVEVRYDDQTTGFIQVQKDVIICTGAISSPQLLMISGIGPKKELENHNITVKVNLPSVGENLFDHMHLPLYINLKSPISVTLRKLQKLSTILDYFLYGNGFLASNGVMGMARMNQSAVILFGIGSTDEKILRGIANIKKKIFRALFPAHKDDNHEGFLFLASCWQPKSRGNITLRSNNILDPPRIDPAYLEKENDVSCMQEAIKLAVNILDTPLFRQFGASIHVPEFDDCRYLNQNYLDKKFSECVLRIAALTSYHPGGTCRISSDDDGVVDEYLRVKGIDRLRIMDASVLPSPISGMPNSVLIAMAERAVDLIRSKEFLDSRNY